MKKFGVAVLVLLAGCAATQKIYMTNAAGQRVSCDAPAGGGDFFSAMGAAVIPNTMNQVREDGARGAVSCIEQYQRAGYAVEVPARPIRAVAYAVAGPLHDKGFTGAIQGMIVAQGTKGRFLVQRPDGVSCEGNFATFQGSGGPDRMIVRYREVVGISISTDGMVPGMSLGSCTNGAQFQAEYYVVRGTDTGFGVGTDSDGNVYKILSQ